MSDLGNARVLFEWTYGYVAWVPEASRFYTYDGGIWTPDVGGQVRHQAHRMADDMVWRARRNLAELREPSKEARRSAQDKVNWWESSQNRHRLSAMIHELEAFPEIQVNVDQLDAHPHLLAFQNGVVDLRTGDLQPHSPDLRLTKRIEVEYDPNATAPRWEAFLSEVHPAHPEMAEYLQRRTGYGLHGSTMEQCFWCDYGTGANGKGVFYETLAYVFGPITHMASFTLFEEQDAGKARNDIAALRGSRLVLASESGRTRAMDEATIKRVTGSDTLRARFLYHEEFEFQPEFTITWRRTTSPCSRAGTLASGGA